MERSGIGLTSEQVLLLMREADTDGDGNVSYSEVRACGALDHPLRYQLSRRELRKLPRLLLHDVSAPSVLFEFPLELCLGHRELLLFLHVLKVAGKPASLF